jgi:hypothetical protein
MVAEDVGTYALTTLGILLAWFFITLLTFGKECKDFISTIQMMFISLCFFVVQPIMIVGVIFGIIWFIWAIFTLIAHFIFGFPFR